MQYFFTNPDGVFNFVKNKKFSRIDAEKRLTAGKDKDIIVCVN